MKRILCFFAVALFATEAFPALLESSNMVPWITNLTVGVRGGVPQNRTTEVLVTGLDTTGSNDASAAINAAIAAAADNTAVKLPAGIFDVRNGIYITHSNITLRGDGTNTILVGSIKVGHDADGGIGSFVITNGATKGSTSITLSNLARAPFGDHVQLGDIFFVSELTQPSDDIPYIIVGGDATKLRVLEQPVLVTGISGNTLTITPPLIRDFTNATQAYPDNATEVAGLKPTHSVGLENFIISSTYSNFLDSAPSQLIKLTGCVDCWVTNVFAQNSANYGIYLADSVHCEIRENVIRFSRGTGSNHGGLLAGGDSGCLIVDNIFSDGLQPAIEFNTGFVGNAVFGNFFTNDIIYIDNHGPHSIMNLWEANVCDSYEMDGYFGSSSHQTLLRNVFSSGFTAVLFKRWTSHMQLVGNILGRPSGVYSAFESTQNIAAPVVIQLGYPNIGNNNYTHISPPSGWNWPGDFYYDASQNLHTNGFFVITNDQVLTTNLVGNFTNVVAPTESLFPIVFQDPVNTNTYYSGTTNQNGQCALSYAAGTSSNLLLNTPVTVSNGWRVFVQGQMAYQQLQLTNQYTDIISGNYEYYDNVLQWDANGAQSIPISLLYSNGAPWFWGSTAWPAVNPTNHSLSAIPAQLRYPNLPANFPGGGNPSNGGGGGGGGGGPLPPAQCNSAADITTGLVGMWPFEEGNGTTAADVSGLNNAGTLVAGAGWTNGFIGNSALLLSSNTDQYVNVPNVAALNSSAVSVCAWINVKAYQSGYNAVITKGAEPGGYRLFIRDTGQVAIYLAASGGTVSYDAVGSNTIPVGSWHHLAFTYDSTSGLTGYVDGNVDYSVAANGTISANAKDFRIGEEEGFNTERVFNGDIDDVRVFNRALTCNDIGAIYTFSRVPPPNTNNVTKIRAGHTKVKNAIFGH